MLKKFIRKEYALRRQELPDQLLQEWTAQMMQLFQKLSFPHLQHVLSYYPMQHRNEFDIQAVIKILTQQYQGLKVSWPKIDTVTHTFEAFEENPQYGFLTNEYQIPEPFNGFPVDPELIDLVFVPLLAVNMQGFRVGYGKGYYDRFLPLCRPNVIKLGFSYFEPIEEINDIHHFDVPLSYCITPTKIYEF